MPCLEPSPIESPYIQSGRFFVYIGYLDDSDTKNKSQEWQVISAVLVPANSFSILEFMSAVTVEDLMPEDRVDEFEEFHASQLYGGYPPFEGIDQQVRLNAIRSLLGQLNLNEITRCVRSLTAPLASSFLSMHTRVRICWPCHNPRPYPHQCWQTRTRLTACSATSRLRLHCRRASQRAVTSPPDLLGYCRWDSRSDRVISPGNHRNDFQVAPTRRSHLRVQGSDDYAWHCGRYWNAGLFRLGR
jgi:hypothetical protein